MDAPVQATLALEERSADHLSGVFGDRAGGLRFDIRRAQGQGWIVLETLDGRTILRVVHNLDTDSTEGSASAAYMGFSPESSIEALPFADLLMLPESRFLPALSYELGAHGIRGDTYPSSYPLHALALAVMRVSASADADAQGKTSDGDFIAEGVQALDVCQTAPQGDKCNGMCGSNCSCVTQVCGDCCWHQGCQIHDLTGFYCETHDTCCSPYWTFTSYFWVSNPCSQESIDLSFVHERCKPQGSGGVRAW